MKIYEIEYVVNHKGEVLVTEMEEKAYILNQTHRHIITAHLEDLTEEWPTALTCLEKRYFQSKINRMYFEFQIIRMWIKLHLGQTDHQMDIDETGNQNIEHCYCAQRGECDGCNLKDACYPIRSTNLRKAEINVLRLLVLGLDESAVADSLCIALNTVKKHRQNMLTRYDYHKTSQLIDMWNRLKMK